MKRANGARIVTTTSLCEEALKKADDLLTVARIASLTGRSAKQCLAALIHLRKHRVVDVIMQEKSYWLWAGGDTRQCVHAEYLPHEKPRRRRAVMLKEVTR